MGRRYITDEDTGEITYLEEGDRIIKANSLKYLRELNNRVEPPKDEDFLKLFNLALPQLTSIGLSVPESRVFFYLLENVRFESNVAKHNNGRLITREHISDDLQMPISNIHRSIVKLCNRGMIAIAKIDIGKVFIVNPFIAMRGKSIDKTTYDLFKNTRWARNWDKPRS
ncbi:MAG: hypothetical protein PHE79_09670 [Eubacteriales bacterium]|nr:hypothetical protein [Eubacteriales bacterium]